MYGTPIQTPYTGHQHLSPGLLHHWCRRNLRVKNKLPKWKTHEHWMHGDFTGGSSFPYLQFLFVLKCFPCMYKMIMHLLTENSSNCLMIEWPITSERTSLKYKKT